MTALPIGSSGWMLGTICQGRCGKPLSRNAAMIDLIARQLNGNPRPIVVDEADAIICGASAQHQAALLADRANYFDGMVFG